MDTEWKRSDLWWTGNVGIGVTNPSEKLTVDGKIHTERLLIDSKVPGPDYVFDKDYHCALWMSLKLLYEIMDIFHISPPPGNGRKRGEFGVVPNVVA